MKKIYTLLSLALLMSQAIVAKILSEPDSAYIFAYSPGKSNGHNGLHIAWSLDGKNWHPIGANHSFVRSDYGRWGSQKRMIDPYLFRANDGLWHCVWTLNEHDGAFAHAASRDLIYWMRQSYPPVMTDGNCLAPAIVYNRQNGEYTVSWQNGRDGARPVSTSTKDFKTYTPAKKIDENLVTDARRKITIAGNPEKGTVNKVAWTMIDGLIKAQQLADYQKIIWAESAKTDPERFAGLQPVNAVFTPDISNSKKISNLLVGIFFEDINYSADGGIYAELVQNRDFEYSPADKEGRDANWTCRKAWTLTGNGATFAIDSVQPVHPNNKHYAVLQVNTVGTGLANEGWDGIALKAGEKYDFSVFARTLSGKGGKLMIRLAGIDGKIYGEAFTKAISTGWKKYDAILTAKETVSSARIEVIPQAAGSVALDMISLFPQKTFKGRKNGLRPDLAQTLADMKPRFVRFPGGCVAHGDGIGNIYRWENTIGPLEARKPQRNLWGYHQTAGLGYYEYFLFCEDIGAEPVPVVAAGVPCQNSAHHGHALGGQQCGIPMHDMDDYVQSILNLVEWANGDAKTVWGKQRAEAGHPAPFNLKYLGIGNEDLITDVFEERFTMIYNAVKAKYPEIEVIGTAGPFIKKTTDYVEGWKLADKLELPLIDEHYYQSPGWFIHNQDYYDSYDRSKSKVYLGEYAAHLPGRPSNVETALAEALHLTTLERNGDIVHMASYAPLLAKEGHTQWTPDLIYFNNTEVKPTVDYYVQQLFGQNAGDEYLPGSITLSSNRGDVQKRVAVSFVRDSKSNDLIVKSVNLLPVAVNATVDLQGVRLAGTEAVKTVLSGAPEDRDAKPETSTCTVSGSFDSELPPYSFTVLRMKMSR
jgi:alpha-L-arabinofuranosidase